MADALGWRCKVGLLVDAADIVVQPECEGMRPVGVTNHTARMDTGHSDKRDAALAPLLADADVDAALVRLMSPEPDHIVLADSRALLDPVATTRLKDRIRDEFSVPCSTVIEALPAALSAANVRAPIAVLSGFGSESDAAIVDFFDRVGIAVCKISRLAPDALSRNGAAGQIVRRAMQDVDQADAGAIVLLGLPVAVGQVAAEAEHWLGKPVISANTAVYWHAMRQHGISDQVAGFGALLERF